VLAAVEQAAREFQKSVDGIDSSGPLRSERVAIYVFDESRRRRVGDRRERRFENFVVGALRECALTIMGVDFMPLVGFT